MVFEIFSYWNMKELELVFNAVAAIVGSGDFLGLLRTLAIVGLLSMAMAVLAGFAQLPDFGRWIIMLAIFNGMLLVPKVNVVLTDRTGTQPPRTVSNVPIGLAAFAHSISHIGDWLTTTFETTFSLPDDIQFRQNGTLFGHRVQQEILHAKFDNSILNSNLLEFYRECVVPEFATGYVVASDMAQSNDIWGYLNGKTNPGRLVTIRDVQNPGNPTSTLGCDDAYTQIGAQINYVNTKQIEGMGRRLYPGLPTAQASAAVKNAIQSSTNYILGISQDAMATTKQTAMSNFMIDAQYLEPAQIGDTARAASNLAQAQAIRATSESYRLMAKLAESTMPKIKNIVELIQYAIFPVIILLVLMAGHKGGMVLKAYVMSLVWIQLWPPLYAILHFVMTVHAQELASMTNGLGLSLAEYNRLSNAYISDEAVAGMIAAVAIPAIASAIVKGGDVGVQALGGLVAPTREASTVASGMASGSFSMGSASLGSQSANNLSMGQVNTAASIDQGRVIMTGSDAVRHGYGREDGQRTHVIDNTAAIQKIGANIKLNGQTTDTLTRMSQEMETAALTETVSASKSMAAAINKAQEFSKTHAKGELATETDSTGSTAQFLQATSTATNLADKWGREHGIKQEQMAEFMAYARAEASGGLNIFGTGATVGGGVRATGKSGAGTSQVQKLAHELAQTKEFREAVQKADTASRQSDFAKSDSAESRAANSIRASLEESTSHLKSAAASHTKAQTYASAATKTQQAGAGFDVLANNRFAKWMMTQINPTTGKNFTLEDIEDMSRNAKDDLLKYASRFVKEELVPRALKDMQPPSNTVAATHESNNGKIPGAEDVASFNAANQAEVAARQRGVGVNPNEEPKNTVSSAVDRTLGRADQQINLGNSAITAEGQPLQDSITANTDPTRQNNIGLAAQNAAASVLPEGTMKLLDAAGGVSQDAGVAKPVADSYKGSLVDAAIDTAIFAGSMAIGGGVGGKAVNAAVGKFEGLVASAGRISGNAARDTAKAVAGATEKRLGTAAAEAERAGAPEAAEAARKAAEHTATNAGVTAANAGAKAEVKAAQTVDVLGKVTGAVVGGMAGNEITGKDWSVQKVKETNEQVMDIVDDLTGQNEPPANTGQTPVRK